MLIAIYIFNYSDVFFYIQYIRDELKLKNASCDLLFQIYDRVLSYEVVGKSRDLLQMLEICLGEAARTMKMLLYSDYWCKQNPFHPFN